MHAGFITSWSWWAKGHSVWSSYMMRSSVILWIFLSIWDAWHIFQTCRENTPYWKEKEINPIEQRSKGYCPLTPKEVGIFLTALGYTSNTPIYLAAGKIYGGDSHMADLRSRFPILMSKVRVVWLASYCCLTHVLDFSILLNHWAPNGIW